MRAHDVRRLRMCEVCHNLADKDNLIAYSDGGGLCEDCALYRCEGNLRTFMSGYPVSEWKKLTLGKIGADGMRLLLKEIERCDEIAKARE